MAWNVMDALNNKAKSAAVDNKPKAKFRTKDIEISKMYSNNMNFYSLPDIEQLAQDIFAVGLLENLTVVHDPCDRGEYRIIAGERRWRALTYLVEQGHEEFSVASCQIRIPAEEHEELIQLIIANTYRNKTTADILEEQKQLEETLKYMKENGLTLHGYKLDSGRLRDTIADMMQTSSTKIAQIESINKKLIPEFTEELKEGHLTFSAAYEISKMSEDIQEDMLEYHREKGLTYKDVKEYAEEQKKAEEEEQIDGQLSIDDMNEEVCQNLTPEISDQDEKGEEHEETEEKEEPEEIETPDTTTVSELEEKEESREEHQDKEIDPDCPAKEKQGYDDCPPDQSSCPRQNWGTSPKEQHEGQKECAKCWNRYKSLHKQENADIPKEKTMENEEERHEEQSGKTDIEIAEEEHKKAVAYLQMAEKEYGANDRRIQRQKILVAALTNLLYDLKANEGEYRRKLEQPELPKFRNNDQRKDWLRNYKEWGVWYSDLNIGVNYYKYDFADGSRLIATEYPEREIEWNGEKSDSYFFHLLEKNRKSYTGRIYDKKYVHAPDSETYLVEFLKNLQKKG